MSKFATPTPASTIRSDMSHVIDDDISAMHDTYDETASMPDTTVPLGEIIESEYDDDSDDENMPVIPEGYLFNNESYEAILACPGKPERKRLLIKWNKESLRDRTRPDPAFATSPICVPDKDYEFSVDPDILLWLNLIRFMAMNLKLLWHILLS